MSMHSLLSRRSATACLILASVAMAPAWAGSDPDLRQQQELAAARAELQAAARRAAELSLSSGMDPASIESIRIAKGEFDGKPRLGVLLAADAEEGVRPAGVTPGSGAEKAGLRAGDRLVRIQGKPVIGASGAQRVASARAALADLKTDPPVRITYERAGQRRDVEVTAGVTRPMVLARTFTREGGNRDLSLMFDAQELEDLRNLDPQMRTEVMRLVRPRSCSGEACATPLLSDALRWDGLNLAALNPQLGRYFGTDRGVLVLSQGALPGLQAGDVIQKIEGKAITNPREAMQAMTAKKPGEQARSR